MNIEKWLYPRPPVKWRLKDHELQIIWVPVYRTSTLSGKHKKAPKEEGFDNVSPRSKQFFVEMLSSSQTTQFEQIQVDDSLFKSEPIAEPRLTMYPEQKTPIAIITSESRTMESSMQLYSTTLWVMPESPDLPQTVSHKIPCMVTMSEAKDCVTLLYFHSNAEDIYLCSSMCDDLAAGLGVNVVAVEYPSYSYYKSNACHEEQICKDALAIYDFIVDTLQWPSDRVYVMGRSIGCIPAIYLASHRPVSLLFLVSPFISIKHVLKDHYGVFGSLGSLVIKAGYDNSERIRGVKCPTLIVHGKKDKMIGTHQSIRLFELLPGKAELILPDEMTHNKIDVMQHLIRPLCLFTEKVFRDVHRSPVPSAGIPLRYFDYDTAL